MSVRAGEGYKLGAAAVTRKYKGDQYQKMRFYGGTKRNIRNKGNKCLDVGRDVNNTHVYWHSCRNGP
jgi:hypothetical protein